ncbi:hypothetical protein Ahy_B06g080218 [Arachis hypogaea]|uniref:Chaperone DnaJ C-terminal domain-containing protein n=1 Tax=Arachis hypogaea TaxID=3818 RepID=A0A444YHD1_ARAHY|nr:hypothetical protein Ahy_B06g080218 [Arachis hypogaea]
MISLICLTVRRTQDLSLSPLLSRNRGHRRLPPGSRELAFLLVPSSSLSSLPSSSFFITVVSFSLPRFEIVNGVTEVEGIAEEKTAGAEEDEEKGVPAFWLNAMKNNEVLAEELTPETRSYLKRRTKKSQKTTQHEATNRSHKPRSPKPRNPETQKRRNLEARNGETQKPRCASVGDGARRCADVDDGARRWPNVGCSSRRPLIHCMQKLLQCWRVENRLGVELMVGSGGGGFFNLQFFTLQPSLLRRFWRRRIEIRDFGFGFSILGDGEKEKKIKFKGKGDEKPGYLPADIVFIIEEKKHNLFRREGNNNLEICIEIPLVDALTGCSLPIPILGGEKLTLSFENTVVYPGYVKVIEGQGMPTLKNDGKRGDLHVKFLVDFP